MSPGVPRRFSAATETRGRTAAASGQDAVYFNASNGNLNGVTLNVAGAITGGTGGTATSGGAGSSGGVGIYFNAGSNPLGNITINAGGSVTGGASASAPNQGATGADGIDMLGAANTVTLHVGGDIAGSNGGMILPAA